MLYRCSEERYAVHVCGAEGVGVKRVPPFRGNSVVRGVK